MLSIFDGLRDLTLLSVVVRLALAFICGGIIGIERAIKRRPAGFRTHILVCLGAALTTMTSQFLYLYMGYYTDISRLGAQVIAGLGFLGAGTIITSHKRVKGLTTAAGLWTAGIVGLALGAGFYEGALLVTVLVELAATVFLRLEHYVVTVTSNVHLFVEYDCHETLDEVLRYCRDKNIDIMNLEVSRSDANAETSFALLSLRLSGRMHAGDVLRAFKTMDGVILAEEF